MIQDRNRPEVSLEPPPVRWWKRLLRILAAVAIVLIGIAGATYLQKSASKPQRRPLTVPLPGTGMINCYVRFAVPIIISRHRISFIPSEFNRNEPQPAPHKIPHAFVLMIDRQISFAVPIIIARHRFGFRPSKIFLTKSGQRLLDIPAATVSMINSRIRLTIPVEIALNRFGFRPSKLHGQISL